jgi:inorganic pyrophosphatase
MDGDDFDDKIIAIPENDPTWNFYQDLMQLPPHVTTEIAHFFEVYKALENKKTATNDVVDKAGAMKIISEAIESYKVHYCGKLD